MPVALEVGLILAMAALCERAEPRVSSGRHWQWAVVAVLLLLRVARG